MSPNHGVVVDADVVLALTIRETEEGIEVQIAGRMPRPAAAKVLRDVADDLDDRPEPCPECSAGKHGNCDGTAWDNAADERIACPCATANHEP